MTALEINVGPRTAHVVSMILTSRLPRTLMLTFCPQHRISAPTATSLTTLSRTTRNAGTI